MTDRDTFAAAALTGLLAQGDDGSFSEESYARAAYRWADVMLRERGVTEPMPKENGQRFLSRSPTRSGRLWSERLLLTSGDTKSEWGLKTTAQISAAKSPLRSASCLPVSLDAASTVSRMRPRSAAWLTEECHAFRNASLGPALLDRCG